MSNLVDHRTRDATSLAKHYEDLIEKTIKDAKGISWKH